MPMPALLTKTWTPPNSEKSLLEDLLALFGTPDIGDDRQHRAFPADFSRLCGYGLKRCFIDVDGR